MSDTVLKTKRDRVLVLTLNRPDAKNAFNETMYKALATAIRNPWDDEDVGAIVLTGAGDAFCAGQDLHEMGQIDLTAEMGFTLLLDALLSCELPIVGAVNGVGIGFGFTMLLHLDIVYIAECARLRAPFVPLGLVPEAAGSYLMPLIMGRQRSAEVLYTGRWVTAAEAVEYGLALRALPSGALLPAAIELAARIAQQPQGALSASKRILKAGFREAIDAARNLEGQELSERLNAPENKAALEAFRSKK